MFLASDKRLMAAQKGPEGPAVCEELDPTDFALGPSYNHMALIHSLSTGVTGTVRDPLSVKGLTESAAG